MLPIWLPFSAGQKINVERARKEHEDLVETLRRIGLDVIELPSDEKHPDGLFVDDVAVVIHGTALMCNPPTFKDRPSRQGEVMSLLLVYSNSNSRAGFEPDEVLFVKLWGPQITFVVRPNVQ